MVCRAEEGPCWCQEFPPISPLPKADDAGCVCPQCLQQLQYQAQPSVVQHQLDQIDAAIKAAAKPEPPPDAKPGEWLSCQFDKIEYPGGYFTWTGTTFWVPKHLFTARALLVTLDQCGRPQ